MDIQVKTSSGWTAPSLPFAVLSAPTITPVAPTTGAFAQGVQIGDAQTAGLQAGAEKLADSLNPVSQKERALKSAQIDEEASMLSRRQKIRASADAQTGAFNAAATPPPASGAAFSAPKANAASAAADVAAPLPEADPGAPPALLDPASKGKATGALAPVGTQPTGAGTAAPAPAQTDSGALSSVSGATTSKLIPYNDGSRYYADQNGRSHIDILAGTTVPDKLEPRYEGSGTDRRTVYFNEIGQKVSGAGSDASSMGSAPVSKATSAYNQKAAEKFAETAASANSAATQLLPLIQEYRKVRTEGLTLPDGTVVKPSTGTGAGFTGFANAANQYLESRKQKIAMLQNLMKGSQSNIEGERLLKSGPQQSNQEGSDLAILDSIEKDVTNVRNQNKFIGSRIAKGATFDDASEEWASKNGGAATAIDSKASPEDTQAMQWLQSNPNDPRASKVAAALQAKGLIGGK